MKSILIHNALVTDGTGALPVPGWVLTEGPRIKATGQGLPPQVPVTETLDAQGAFLMPGVIDCHVHFREPGLTHKATIASESRAALAGGVTSYIDMPNTKPPTVSIAAWEDKMARAEATSSSNYAFMIGATADNLAELTHADPRLMPAVKVFMGSSTGGMLLTDDAVLRAIFADQPHTVVVHAEDQTVIDRLTARYKSQIDPADISWHSRLRPAECCVRATEHALTLAQRYGTRLHVAHVTTAEECRLFDPAPSPRGKRVTAEVSPHHLTRCDEDYAALGARIKMNPSVKSAADRETLRAALLEGRLDMVATDHAPHTLDEKRGDVFSALSGAPVAQFSLPLMMELFGPQTVAQKLSCAPAETFRIKNRGRIAPGMYADLVLVEHLDRPHVISDADVLSPCGWTPAIGLQVNHRVARTIVNGDCGPLPLEFD